jgi:hypothetical protein
VIVQNIYFHLNHPIRYVYICGVITEIEYINNRYTLLTLDDGSGSTIEVKITHVLPDAGKSRQDSVLESQQQDIAEEDAFWVDDANSKKTRGELTPTTYKTHTAGLIINIHPRYDNSIIIDKTIIDIGSTIKAKGTLGIWRDTFQMNLLRTFVVKDIDTEVEVWEGYAEFVKEVLCKPWQLSMEEVQALEKQERDNLARERKKAGKVKERARAKRERDVEKRREWEEKKRRHEVRAEKKRKIMEVEMNGGALRGL